MITWCAMKNCTTLQFLLHTKTTKARKDVTNGKVKRYIHQLTQSSTNVEHRLSNNKCGTSSVRQQKWNIVCQTTNMEHCLSDNKRGTSSVKHCLSNNKRITLSVKQQMWNIVCQTTNIEHCLSNNKRGTLVKQQT